MLGTCGGSRSIARWPLFIVLGAAFLCATNSGRGTPDTSATSEESASVSGKLVDSAGDPVFGARLSLYRLDEKRHWAKTGATVTSGAMGGYRFGDLGKEEFRIVVEKDGLARTIVNATPLEERQQKKDIVLRSPVASIVTCRDETGVPIAGARLRAFGQRGVNGSLYYLSKMWMKELGVEGAPSDEMGRMRLPSLAQDEIVHLWIEHANFAPVELRDVVIRQDVAANATLRRGVKVKMHFAPTALEEYVTDIRVHLRHIPFDNPSTITDYETPIASDGTAALTVEPGDYSVLRFEHDDYCVTPTIGSIKSFQIAAGRNDELWFQLRRKIEVRGRLIDAETGEPLADKYLFGETLNSASHEMPFAPVGKWAGIALVSTDKDGKYAIALPEGTARMNLREEGLLSESDYTEFSVAKDSSNVIPDIKARRLPKVTGVVQNPDGTPASKVVVRFRGKHLRYMQPVITDEAGRFELEPAWVPLDRATEERLVTHPLAAFDPYRPLAARADVRVDKSDAGILKLEPHDPDWVLSAFAYEFTDWEQAKVTPERAQEIASITLQNQLAPELDGLLWLNSARPSMHLADFRGKFVLLDFWTTWCGPCHRDFPSVKLVHQLYGDDVVVIGVHDNSVAKEAVREHVYKIGLPFPVVVDHPDGRTLARYEKHGISGYPSYLLLGPDGKVLLDDSTIPNPALRRYKLEIIRKLILAARSARN